MSETLHVIDVATSSEFKHAPEVAAEFIGTLVTREHVGVEEVKIYTPQTTLDKLRLAEVGDAEATLSVAANVHSELVEWARKTKNIMSSRSQLKQDGQVSQSGHDWRDVQANTILRRKDSSLLQARAPIETVNNFRMELAIQNGALADYWFVASSLVPGHFTADQAEKEAFFAEEMSASIQATTLDAYGVLTECAFVAGADNRDAPRFDIATMKAVYAELGINVSGCTTEEILARPLLIHKSMMPNGVSDFVKLYDKHAGEGRFFGVKGATGEYDNFAEFCFDREREFDELTSIITEKLIDERHTFNVPEDVVRRISQLAKHNLVDWAKTDLSIDPRIFGYEAANFLQQVREHLEHGNVQEANKLMKKAHQTAKGGACGTFSGAEGGYADPKTGKDSDWSGGSKEKLAKCKSCKSFKFEIGGCKICEDCVKRPWVMQKAWDDFKKEKKEKLHAA